MQVEDLAKKLRALGKKLRQIEDLKKKQSEGTTLEANQVYARVWACMFIV